MGNLAHQTKNELKQLPLMLGKLIGGLLAVGGLGATVWINTHGADPPLNTSWFSLLIGTGGIVIFVLSARRMIVRSSTALTPVENKRMNLVAWLLLLLLTALFLLGVMFFLR